MGKHYSKTAARMRVQQALSDSDVETLKQCYTSMGEEYFCDFLLTHLSVRHSQFLIQKVGIRKTTILCLLQTGKIHTYHIASIFEHDVDKLVDAISHYLFQSHTVSEFRRHYRVREDMIGVLKAIFEGAQARPFLMGILRKSARLGMVKMGFISDVLFPYIRMGNWNIQEKDSKFLIRCLVKSRKNVPNMDVFGLVRLCSKLGVDLSTIPLGGELLMVWTRHLSIPNELASKYQKNLWDQGRTRCAKVLASNHDGSTGPGTDVINIKRTMLL